jgi:hypothetical protein
VSQLNADLLDGLDSSAFVRTSTLHILGAVTANASATGTGVVIGTVGHFTFTGSCLRSNADEVETTITSDTAHSAYAAQTQSVAGTQWGNADLTGAGLLASVAFASGTPDINPTSGSAIAADGQEVMFDLYQTMNARAQDGQCVFGGVVAVK